jgi:hypothetical protein
MSGWRGCLVVAALGAVAVGTAGGRKPAAPKGGVFGPLESGRLVDVREGGGGFTLTVVPPPPPGPKVVVGKAGGLPLPHKVVEVAADYVVLEDPRTVSQLRIPVSAVRVVIVPPVGKGKRPGAGEP